jgi:formylglycine-generating enzyme required for sulfatase activity
MITRITIVFVLLLLDTLSQAQTTSDRGKAGSNIAGSTSHTLRQSSANNAKARESNVTEAVPVDVLIATNEDCFFLLNDEVKGVALKDAFLYLKLNPGKYSYTARSQKTGDVYTDSFTVAKWQLNEVFIDMLYAIDAGKEKSAGIEKEQQATVTADNPIKPKPEEETTQDPVKQKELMVINSLIADMVVIRGGSFVMGNNQSPAADETEHPVSLNAFSMGKYEVTQEQWEQLMGYNPSINRGCATCPVENVSWEEVMIFIRKLNSLSNKRFRLPTEAEWEYVARWGGKAEIEKAGGAEAFIQSSAWSFINSNQRSHPVGTKQPNTAGIYDLFGNVSEWCMDWYGAFFYKEDYTEKNPQGPPLGKEKIIRGGNYKDYLGDRFRPSFRNKMNPKAKGSEVGIRLVMEES